MLHILIIGIAFSAVLAKSVSTFWKIRDNDFNSEEILMVTTGATSLFGLLQVFAALFHNESIAEYLKNGGLTSVFSVGGMWLSAISGLAICHYVSKKHEHHQGE